ncbi:MAG: nitroreductase family protein [Deltaproteobacteria bacterium]|nr:nitroreductase family protein [Deltaproteobacteria bacterium]
MDGKRFLETIQKRRSVRVYKSGKVTEPELGLILEAARWAPSGANTQPWEFVVTRDRAKMKRVREIYDNEWKRHKREDPVHYKGLYLTTRQPGDREKLFQASVANAVEHMMLMAASLGFGTVWVSVREEVEPELRELFHVPEPLRLLWVVPVGHARNWPRAKPRRQVSDFTHQEIYNPKKLRDEAQIRAWPKG